MAQIQEYGKQIAPPESTGEVLDTQSAGLAAAKASAVINGVNAAGSAINGIADTFAKIGAINKQAEYTDALDGYDKDWQKIQNMINATPTAVGSWAPDEEGNRGDLLNRWHENTISKYGANLKGRYADEFAHQTNQRVLAAEAQLGEFSLARQRDGIAAKDMTFVDNLVNNPDISNPERWLNDAMGQIEDRYMMSFNSGVYTETQVAEGLMNAKNAAMQNTYKKITSDIQDSDGWNHPINPRMGEDGQPAPYIGLNGALDFIADQEEAGRLNPGQAAQMVAQVDEQNRIRTARGSNVQSSKSIDYIQDWSRKILVEGVIPTYAQLIDDERINRETTDNYTRDGDKSAMNYIVGLLDDTLAPSGGDDFKWDWNTIIPLDGGQELYDLFWDPTLDNDAFSERAAQLRDNYGIDPMALQYVMDRTRDTVFADTMKTIKSEVEDFYKSMLDGAKNEEERLEINSLMAQDVMGIVQGIEDPDITTRVDVAQILDNYKTKKIAGTIFKDFISPERDKMNASEAVLKDLQEGKFRGLNYIPRFAEQSAQVGELHRQMLAQQFGEENIEQMRWGDNGTMAEGRSAFLIRDWNDMDANGQATKKWFQYDYNEATKEEVLVEFNPNAYDDRIGEVWTRSESPMLQEQEAARDEVVEDERGIMRHLVDTQGATYQDLLDDGHSALEIQEAFGTTLVDVPGSPNYRGMTGELKSFYNRNVQNGQIPYSLVASHIQSEGLNDVAAAQFYEQIWEKQKDTIKTTLLGMEEAGDINIQNNNGGRRSIANRVLAREIAKYGLSRDYLDPVYDYVYGGTE